MLQTLQTQPCEALRLLYFRDLLRGLRQAGQTRRCWKLRLRLPTSEPTSPYGQPQLLSDTDDAAQAKTSQDLMLLQVLRVVGRACLLRVRAEVGVSSQTPWGPAAESKTENAWIRKLEKFENRRTQSRVTGELSFHKPRMRISETADSGHKVFRKHP